MNACPHQLNKMIPSAHGSEQSGQHYTLPAIKHDTSTDKSSSNVALNFSNDLLHQTSHQNHLNVIHHQSIDGSVESSKLHLNNSFELDSGSLMQTATNGVNMWKSPMSLNHFKHPIISDHNFLPNSELNSFSNWSQGNNLNHQQPQMNHILETPHLIGYSPHQRTISIANNQNIVGSMKNQSTAEQASFMLNSIGHQASVPQISSSGHQPTTHPLDNLALRSHSLDHGTSYNLTINNNQFYGNSRADGRSHHDAMKPSFVGADRSIHMTLNNHQNSLQFNHVDHHHTNSQPTISQQVAGSSSSGSSSKGAVSFICSTCNESFALRTVYQNHLKTHSHDKVSKAKFHCELCGHSFSQKTSLNRHMKSHTGERPFPCETCNKAFSEKERLKIHMRTHTGEKPFSCGICGKSFSQKSTVKRHQTVHTGEKKFRCDCGKGFANRGNLIAHIKTRGSNHFE